MSTSRTIGYASAAALALVSALQLGCGDSGQRSADQSALRPNGSQKVKVTFAGGQPAVAGQPAAVPAMGAAAPSPEQVPVPESKGALTWTDPLAWQSSPPSSAMRRAQYRIPGAQGAQEGELIVYYFGPAGAGGLDETFARWAAAFNDAAVGKAKRSTLKAGELDVNVLEVAGDYRDTAGMTPGAPADSKPKTDMMMLGAIVQGPDGPYYFKLLGPSKTVESAREAFVTMLKSSRAGT